MALVSTIVVFWFVVIWLVSSLPLYFSLKIVGKKKDLLTVALVNIAAGAAASVVSALFGFFTGAILGFITLLFIYKNLFNLTWTKAFWAWVLQIVLAIVMFWIAIILIGVPLLVALV